MINIARAKQHTINAATGGALLLCSLFSQAAEKCPFLDYSHIEPTPVNSTKDRWRVKTHLVVEDKGSPCTLDILNEHNKNGADTRYNIASLTKKMTAVVAWDEIRAGRLELDEELIISDWAYTQSRMRSEKKTISVREALQTMMVGSANDSATTLAVRIMSKKNQALGKRDVQTLEKQFAAQRMTQKAHDLGMVNTHYTNATGLDTPLRSDKIRNGVRYYHEPLSTSTPREQAFLSSYIRNLYPEIMQAAAMPKIYLQNTHTDFENLRITNSNRMLENSVKRDAAPIEGTLGLKTGGLKASGANQSSVFAFNIKGQERYVIIETAGNTSIRERSAKIHSLIDDAKITLNDTYKRSELSVSGDCAHPEEQQLDHSFLPPLAPSMCTHK